MGGSRSDRSSNPLAAMMEESLAELEGDGVVGVGGGEALPEVLEEAGRGNPGAPSRGGGMAAPVRRAGRRRGRPRGGRNSDPNCVPISAKINKDVRFAMDRVLAEQSELAGRPVYMAEVIERLMRFYVEQGDPYQLLEDAR
jgi:hypothetical protein